METVILGEPMVQIRCVWPKSRGPKDDCRGKTKTVWAGYGDIQAYPARLAPLLLAHRDVWELVDATLAAHIESTDAQVEADRQKKIAMARQIVAEADAEDARKAQIEEARRLQLEQVQEAAIAAAIAAQEAAGKGIEMVTATPNTPGTAAPPPPGGQESVLFDFASAEQLKTANDESIHAVARERGYALHPRLNPENLRVKFMEAQMADERVKKPEA